MKRKITQKARQKKEEKVKHREQPPIEEETTVTDLRFSPNKKQKNGCLQR